MTRISEALQWSIRLTKAHNDGAHRDAPRFGCPVCVLERDGTEGKNKREESDAAALGLWNAAAGKRKDK